MQLPSHFEQANQKTVVEKAKVDQSALRDQNWAQAWMVFGEFSRWIVSLLEGHGDTVIPLQNNIQFMQFISNGFGMGASFVFICVIPISIFDNVGPFLILYIK